MTTQPITIELPELVLRHLQRIAEATHQPMEALVTQSVLSNLPPSIENAPPELQQTLLDMQVMDITHLRAIAQTEIDPDQFHRHTNLLAKNADHPLTPAEQQELANLRQAADHLMLRKTYAWSILRWRGQRIPALNELTPQL
jgi:hypothetical protein